MEDNKKSFSSLSPTCFYFTVKLALTITLKLQPPTINSPVKNSLDQILFAVAKYSHTCIKQSL
jgi:hypothetical protein